MLTLLWVQGEFSKYGSLMLWCRFHDIQEDADSKALFMHGQHMAGDAREDIATQYGGVVSTEGI